MILDAFRNRLRTWPIAVALVTLLSAGVATVAWSSSLATTQMSVLDQLQAKEEIKEQLVLYGFLAEGDGVHPRDTDALMDQLMSPDIVSEQYFPDGTAAFPTRRGRGDGKKYTQPPRDLTKIGEQHYTLGVYFDELTPTTARTRSQQMYITVWKTLPDQPADCKTECGGQIKHVQLNNYFDTWAKTPQGWVKTRSVIHSIN
jgi:hypothetical protein